jgi:hypothetical protein
MTVLNIIISIFFGIPILLLIITGLIGLYFVGVYYDDKDGDKWRE